MSETRSAKNYFAHGGNELVVGGKFDLPAWCSRGRCRRYSTCPLRVAAVLPFLADSTATTVAQLREDYNRLLGALRAAGLMEAGDP